MRLYFPVNQIPGTSLQSSGQWRTQDPGLPWHTQRSAVQPTTQLYSVAIVQGHVDFGVKWQILPLCLKGKFYANHAFVHKGKILRQGCRCGHNDSIMIFAIEFGVKSPCEESWPPLQKLLIHKGKILRQRAKLLGLPLMCLIDRAYPIRSQHIDKQNQMA